MNEKSKNVVSEIRTWAKEKRLKDISIDTLAELSCDLIEEESHIAEQIIATEIVHQQKISEYIDDGKSASAAKMLAESDNAYSLMKELEKDLVEIKTTRSLLNIIAEAKKYIQE